MMEIPRVFTGTLVGAYGRIASAVCLSSIALCMSSGCQRAKGDDVTTVDAPAQPGGEANDPRPALQPSTTSDAGPDINGSLADTPPPDGAPQPEAAGDAGSLSQADPRALALAFPIVFRSDRSAEVTSDLYVMRADGREPRRITRGGEFFLPRWSPDGTQLVFRRVVEGGTFSAELGIAAADGSALTLLTSGENVNLFDLPASWALDGTRIAFGSVVPSDGLWAFGMAPTGGQRERLLPDIDAYQREAAWSPADPSRLAYVEADATGLAIALRVKDFDEPGEPVDLSTGELGRPQQLRWSPDGRRIVVAGFVLDDDGSIAGLGPGPGDAGFVHTANLDLFMIEVETRAVTRLTDDPKDDYEPTWSPDGTQLLFTSDRDGDEDLWLMPLDAPEQAFDLIDDNQAPHQDGGSDWYPLAR
jgi:Tol biopolymer transport system component